MRREGKGSEEGGWVVVVGKLILNEDVVVLQYCSGAALACSLSLKFPQSLHHAAVHRNAYTLLAFKNWCGTGVVVSPGLNLSFPFCLFAYSLVQVFQQASLLTFAPGAPKRIVACVVRHLPRHLPELFTS